MLNRLADLLRRVPPPPDATVGARFARREIAVVALLIEAAQIDRAGSADEQAAVLRIVRERFGLDAAIARELIATARSQLDASLEDWVFAAAVREGFTVDERAGILGLLWEVIYTDGRLAAFEESLMGRLARQLRVGEAASEAARAQAFARVGHSSTPEAE
jgi:uncharacterized tellurite resistance protein B-like protein